MTHSHLEHLRLRLRRLQEGLVPVTGQSEEVFPSNFFRAKINQGSKKKDFGAVWSGKAIDLATIRKRNAAVHQVIRVQMQVDKFGK